MPCRWGTLPKTRLPLGSSRRGPEEGWRFGYRSRCEAAGIVMVVARLTPCRLSAPRGRDHSWNMAVARDLCRAYNATTMLIRLVRSPGMLCFVSTRAARDAAARGYQRARMIVGTVRARIFTQTVLSDRRKAAEFRIALLPERSLIWPTM